MRGTEAIQSSRSSSHIERLRSFVERIERMEDDRTNLAADIREIYAEAKGTGFDGKALRQVVKLRKMDPQDLREQESLLQVYRDALGV